MEEKSEAEVVSGSGSVERILALVAECFVDTVERILSGWAEVGEWVWRGRKGSRVAWVGESGLGVGGFCLF